MFSGWACDWGRKMRWTRLETPGSLDRIRDPQQVRSEFDSRCKLQAATEILRINIGRAAELTACHAHVRIVEVHIVQSVESVEVQLELDLFRDRKVLVEGRVNVEELRSANSGVIPGIRTACV